MKRFIVPAIAALLLISTPALHSAQAEDIGKREYTNSCAICHGDSGKGDGPAAGWTIPPPADLTNLSKRSGGVFPFSRVYDVIDGTREIKKGHGPYDMPIWGRQYSKEASGTYFGYGTPKDIESFTRARIIALVGYLYSLQAK